MRGVVLARSILVGDRIRVGIQRLVFFFRQRVHYKALLEDDVRSLGRFKFLLKFVGLPFYGEDCRVLHLIYLYSWK